MRAAPRIDARLIEHLVGDPVAHAGRERLVEQYSLHRRRALSEELGEPADRWQVMQRIEAEQTDRRLGSRIVTQPHATESAGIAKHDFPAVVEREVQLEKARRPLALVRAPALHDELGTPAATHLDPAGHPEVKAGPGRPVELEPEVLAVAMRRHDTASDQSPPHARRAHALEHDLVGRAADGDDSAADRRTHEQAAGGLDLGQLGHRASVPETSASDAKTAGRRT